MAGTEEREVVIKVRGVVNKFGSQVIHDGVDLDVYRGEVLGVVGGSGSGKSVLLRTIIGLNKQSAGTVEVFGENPVPHRERPENSVQTRWGVLFQEGALFSSQTVAENIQVPLREYTKMSQALMNEVTAMKLSMVGLPEDAGVQIPLRAFRRHEETRGAGARARADPEIVFLDEPTAGLDPISANQFDVLVNDLQKSLNLTVFMVTHDLDTLKATTDRIAVLVNKKIKVGTIDELRKDPDPWIQEYFSRRARPRGAGPLRG